MEISEDLVKTYQQSQLRRLSISRGNKTDMRSLAISAETPVERANQPRRPECDKELAKRLEMIESDSDLTSDEEEVNEAIVPQVQSPRPTFPQPVVSDDNLSINKKVSQNVMESLRELQHSTENDTRNSMAIASNSIIASQSCRLNVTKKRRPSKAPEAVEEYLKLANKRKKSKDSNKKRTLYSHHSDENEDENISPQSSIVSPIEKKGAANLETAESATDSEAQQFRKPYKPGPLKTKKKYEVVVNQPSESSETVEDGSIKATPKTSRPSMHRIVNHVVEETLESELEQRVVEKMPKKSQKKRNKHEQQQQKEVTEEIHQEIEKEPVVNFNKYFFNPSDLKFIPNILKSNNFPFLVQENSQ
jgi:hypothetical protein